MKININGDVKELADNDVEDIVRKHFKKVKYHHEYGIKWHEENREYCNKKARLLRKNNKKKGLTD